MKTYGLCILTASLIVNCSPKSKDVAIKEDITSKAKENVDFAGVSYIVNKGTVILSGLAPTEEAKQRAVSTVNGIAGVQKVSNAIAIGPVVLDADYPLKLKVDSLLKKYNLAQAQVENGTVLLTGQVPKKELPKLLGAIHQLPIEHIQSQLIAE